MRSKDRLERLAKVNVRSVRLSIAAWAIVIDQLQFEQCQMWAI